MRRFFKVLITCTWVLAVGSCYQGSNNKAALGLDSINAYPVNRPLLINIDHNPILQLRIDVLSTEATSVLNGLLFSVGRESLDNILALSIYKGDSVSMFTRDSSLGATNDIQEVIQFSSEVPLVKGPNYFWVSCQLKPQINLDHKVQVNLESIQINGKDFTPQQIGKIPHHRVGLALARHGEGGVDTYRIPGLATTNHGTLIAVYDLRKYSGVDLQEDINVGMSRSTDGGHSWESKKIIMDMDAWGGRGQRENGIGDPSILIDRQSNTIWVAGIWAHGHPGERNWFASKPGLGPMETSQFMLVKSEDDGVTWSDPINITTQIKNPQWHLLLQGPGKGISLQNGTLVFPAQFKDENQVPYSTLIYSTDHGGNWHIGTGLRAKTTEAQVVELSDGRIMINARNNEARDTPGVGRVVATTTDLGSTWDMHPTSINALEESTCMASLINETFDGYGQIMLFSNPNTAHGRFNMTIKSSQDEGMTWPSQQWMVLDSGHGNGYSCLTKIDDQTIGILYESSQADLVFERIPLADVLEHKSLN